jgi:hypothetical protein
LSDRIVAELPLFAIELLDERELVAGEKALISVTCNCGERLAASPLDRKVQCFRCGATFEFGSPVATIPVGEAGVEAAPVLPYRTPPALNAERRNTRWRIAGKSTKRVTCHKCATAYRYEVTRDVRSWSIKLLIGVLGFFSLFGLSCFFPAVLIGAGGLMLVTARIWLRLVIIGFRSVAGGAASSFKDGDFASANRRLRKELDAAVEPVPCPKCGWFQPEMVAEARARSFAWTGWLVFGLMSLAPVIWFVALDYGFVGYIRALDLDSRNPIVAAGLVVLLILLAIALILSLRWAVSLTVDPNRVVPGSLPLFPDAPLAITEAEWTKNMAAQTARITATRQQRPSTYAAGPRRIVPP